MRVRVLRPLEESLGHVVRDVDLRQSDEEPGLLRAPSRRVKGAGLAGGLAVLVAAPLLFAPTSNVTHNLILAAAYVMMALGLNVVVGFAGLLDLGYVAFY